MAAFILFSVTGAAAQDQAVKGKRQPPDQRLEQEAGLPGVPLFLSPATIRRVQQALNRAGYDAGHVNGWWKPDSVIAMKNFQQANGMAPTGTVTIDALFLLDPYFSEMAMAGAREPPAADDPERRP